MKEPLLSIVIPTRNRVSYVVSSVQSVLRLPDDDIELVLHDNSDTDELRSLVGAFNDARIRYIYISERISLTENYNAAVAASRGRFITLIGDDDGVTHFLPLVTRWAAENNVHLTAPMNTAHYVWPDLKMENQNAAGPGELRIQQRPTGAVRRLENAIELQKCLRAGGQSFAGLPKSYYGIVSREKFQEIKNISGSYFPGISPDMASAVALSLVTPSIYHVDLPCFLPGSSRRSNAGLSGLKKHVGRLEDQPHLSETEIKEWVHTIPPFFSVPTIWAEACVQSLIRMGRLDLMPRFNFARLYSELVTYFPQYRRDILLKYSRTFVHSKTMSIFGWMRLLAEMTRLAALRGYYLFRRIAKPIKRRHETVDRLQNILEACMALEERLGRESGLKIQLEAV
jgi:glycosyltransferase involved in cell wall biosynthesis